MKREASRILFIGATHGDEPIGVQALQELEKRVQSFDWIIGSEEAFRRGTRSFEGDLNRSAPGDIRATSYASRRAAEILKIAEPYRTVVDIHGTCADTGIFAIVTNPTPENMALAFQCRVDNIVIWPSISPELTGPLSEHVRCGIEIECGPKDDPSVRQQLVEILAELVTPELAAPRDSGSKKPKRVFEVYGSLKDSEQLANLREFTPTTIQEETFFPLLVGRYQTRDGVTCYKMREVSANYSL